MKKPILTAVAALTAAVLLCLGIYAGEAAQTEAGKSRIAGAQVSLGTDISVVYYAELGPGEEGARMRFTMHGDSVTVDAARTETADGRTLHAYVFDGITPQAMGDNIKAELLLGETVLDTKDEYSVLQNCKNLLSKSADELGLNENRYDAMRVLIADLLQYGAAAQLYKNCNTDALVTADPDPAIASLTPTEFEPLTDTAADPVAPKLVTTVPGNASLTAAGVYFDSANSLYLRFTAPSVGSLSVCVSSDFCEGGTFTADDFQLQQDGSYLLILPPMSASVMSCVGDRYASYTIVLLDDSLPTADKTVQTLTYSLAAYVFSKQNADTPMAALAKAVYNYGLSAAAYANAPAPADHVEFVNWDDEDETQPAVSYDNTHAWVMSDSQDVSEWHGGGAKIGVEFGSLAVRPTNNDPMVILSLKPEEYINASDYKYLAYRYRADATVKNGVFFVASSNHPTFNDAGLVHFSVDTSGEWVNLITDMSVSSFWCDDITQFRIDPINSSTHDAGSCINIERVGFFRTQEDAAQFLAEAETAERHGITDIDAVMYHAFIPNCTTSDKPQIYDYALRNKADTESAVALNGRVIPLSYINDAKYTFFVASKPGSYTTVSLETDGTSLGFVQARGILTGKHSDDKLTRRDIVALVTTLTDNIPNLQAYTSVVRGATVRDLCAALTAYMKDVGFAPYESAIRQCPVLSGRSADAVAYAWKIGLIGERELLNPDRVLTAADAAEITEKMIKACLGLPVLPFGLSEDEISIGCWYGTGRKTLTPDEARQLRACGINTITGVSWYESWDTDLVLQTANEFGIRVMLYTYTANVNYITYHSPDNINARYYDYQSYYGNFICDEPDVTVFETMGMLTEQFNAMLPDKYVYYNLFPMYASASQLGYDSSYNNDPDVYLKYLESYVQLVDTPYICVDIYPNNYIGGSTGSPKRTYNGYLKNMDIVASMCRKYNREFWLYIQTCTLDKIRYPDYNDLRWQVYVGMSFGVESFYHFKYDALFDENGMPNEQYHYVQLVDDELLAMSHDYLQYTNLGAYTLNVTDGMPYAQFDNQYAGIDGLTVDTDLPLLVGCFAPESGSGFAFTLVNMTDINQTGSGTVSFTVPAGYSRVTVWQGGIATEVTPVNGLVTVALEVAEGVFVTVR